MDIYISYIYVYIHILYIYIYIAYIYIYIHIYIYLENDMPTMGLGFSDITKCDTTITSGSG